MGSGTLFPVAASWLLTYATHSTLLLLGAWLLTGRRGVGSNVLRDTIWKVALVGGILTATLQVGIGFEPLTGTLRVAAQVSRPTAGDVGGSASAIEEVEPVRPVERAAGSTSSSEVASTSPATAPSPVDRSARTAPASPRFETMQRVGAALVQIGWLPALLGLWLFGAVVGLGRFAVARFNLWRLLSDRRAVQDPDLLNMVQTLCKVAGLRHHIRITWSPTITTPVALRSEICLPKRALSELSRDHHRAILAHEVAHIARRDPSWIGVGLLVQRILFFQPLNLLARRRLSEVAEYLCDDWAVTHTGTKLTFAECLAEVASWISMAQRPALLSTMAEDGSQLVRRVERILDTRTSPTPWTPHRLRVPSGAVALLAIGVTAPGVSYNSSDRATESETLATPAAPVAVATDTVALQTTAQSSSPYSDAALVADVVQAEQAAPTLSETVPPSEGLPATRAPMGDSSTNTDAIQTLAVGTGARGFALSGDVPDQQSADTAVVNSLVRTLRDENAEVRSAAVQALGQLGSRLAIPGLIAALGDENGNVRYRAAEALSEIRDPRSVEPLRAALADSVPRVRRYAASALGRSGDPRASSFIMALFDDEQAEVRRTAVRIVGRLKSPDAVGPLTAALNDPDDDVRGYAIQALSAIADTRAVAPIIEAANDDSADVRTAAIRALGQFGDPSAVGPLMNALGDSSPRVRGAAIRSLRELKAAQAVPAIIERLQDESADVRSLAVRTLADMRDPSAILPIVGRLRDPDPEVREVAAGVLDDFKDRSVVPPLIAALNDTVPDVREAVIRSLTSIEDPRAVTPILDRLGDTHADVRTIAARSLHEFNDRRVIPSLISLLRDSNPSVVVGALHSLEELEDVRAVEPTIELLSNSEASVRVAAARVLAEFKDPQSVDPLLAMTSDSVPEVRSQALRALTNMREPRAVPAVVAALRDDPSVGIRRNAAGWLAYLKDPRGIDPLIAALQDEDSRVRAAAARALAQLGNR